MWGLKKIGKIIALDQLSRESLFRRRLPWLDFGIPKQNLCHVAIDYSFAQPFSEYLYITSVPYATTGFGHRFGEWNVGRVVARKLGVIFANPGLHDGWDELLGLVNLYPPAMEVLRSPDCDYIRIPYIEWRNNPFVLDEICEIIQKRFRFRRKTLLALGDGQNLYQHNVYLEELMNEFAAVNLGKANTTPNNPKEIKIAVHIRRGDIVKWKERKIGNWAERYVDLAWFIEQMNEIRQCLWDRCFRFEIHSQGNPEDFKELSGIPDTKLFLNLPEKQCFVKMVDADILILSPSSFSFTAGLLSRGVKLAKSPWTHMIPEHPLWFKINGRSLDRERFRRSVISTFE